LARLLDVSPEEAKEITFKNIYGGVKEEYKEKEYFKQVNQIIKRMWIVYQQENKIKLSNGRIIHKTEDLSPTKIFNYYIQSLETKNNVELITQVLDLLEVKTSKIVLYTYDSILIDYSKNDGLELVTQIKNTLENTGFNVKMRKGVNYGL